MGIVTGNGTCWLLIEKNDSNFVDDGKKGLWKVDTEFYFRGLQWHRRSTRSFCFNFIFHGIWVVEAFFYQSKFRILKIKRLEFFGPVRLHWPPLGREKKKTFCRCTWPDWTRNVSERQCINCYFFMSPICFVWKVHTRFSTMLKRKIYWSRRCDGKRKKIKDFLRKGSWLSNRYPISTAATNDRVSGPKKSNFFGI